VALVAVVAMVAVVGVHCALVVLLVLLLVPVVQWRVVGWRVVWGWALPSPLVVVTGGSLSLLMLFLLYTAGGYLLIRRWDGGALPGESSRCANGGRRVLPIVYQ
jgi:hypothetical protein